MVQVERDFNLRIGFAVRRLREQKNLDQRRLAAIAGVTQGSVAHIEKGRRCSINTLVKLADALGVKFSALVERAENVREPELVFRDLRRKGIIGS